MRPGITRADRTRDEPAGRTGTVLELAEDELDAPRASRPTARSGTIFSIFAKTAATTEHAKQGRDLYMTGVVCRCDS
jgi:hypothetical protein